MRDKRSEFVTRPSYIDETDINKLIHGENYEKQQSYQARPSFAEGEVNK